MKAAAPAGGEAREEPRLSLTWSQTGALLLTSVTLARPLQLDISHQVATERRATRFLDVQKDDHIISLDVEVHDVIQLCFREVKSRDKTSKGTVFHHVRILLQPIWCLIIPGVGTRRTVVLQPGSQLVKHLALRPARTHILDHDDAKEQHHEQHNEDPVMVAAATEGLFIHLPGMDSETSLRQSEALPQRGNRSHNKAQTITLQLLATS